MTNKFFISILCVATLIFSGCSSDDDTPSQPIKIVVEGAAITPDVGGPNQPNQVYIDLSTNTTTNAQRDSWDLGFYSGSDFRVAINGSIYMAAGVLTETNIDAVSETSAQVLELQSQVAVGTFNTANMEYIDTPNGSLSGTAIAEISNTDSSNKVYLINLGYSVGNEVPPTGSVSVSGEPRGWKKIRVLKNGDNYLLQYADLNATTHEEVIISKDSDYNFTFFSFNTETEVSVEPTKSNWDLNFTVFTNEIDGFGSYGFTDFVLNNTKNNANAYMIDTEESTLTYDAFSLVDVVDTNFSTDQRSIGSSWRNGGGPGSLPSLKENVFYVVNDTDGNIYKLKFLALTNEAGERGYPKFVYNLLQ